jgi:periplasmic copper chaperone A
MAFTDVDLLETNEQTGSSRGRWLRMRLLPIVIAPACLWFSWFLSPAQAQAHEIKAGDLVIVHPMADEATDGQAMSGGSVEIRNEGNKAEKLLSVSCEFAEKTDIKGNVPVIIPAAGHAAVSLLFKNIKTKLSQDEAYAGELTFERTGKVKIDLMVHTHKH